MHNWHRLGLTVSYNRVRKLENSLANAVCYRYRKEDLVCPATLRKGMFTIGVFDNIDYNSSSSTATGSFHGTGISVFPLVENSGESQPSLSFANLTDPPDFSLPENVSVIPVVDCNISNVVIPPADMPGKKGIIVELNATRYIWLDLATTLLNQNTISKGEFIHWAAYYASLSPHVVNPPSVSAILPLFYEKATSISMIKHGSDIIKMVTQYLNPGQLPVLTVDEPLFALAKYIQWSRPTEYGEDNFLVMFWGLHIEMNQNQYQQFVKERFVERTRAVNDTIIVYTMIQSK